MIPALNDNEMEQILKRARAAGATSAGYTLLRLPLELKSLFKEWLEKHFPDKAAHVLSLVAQTHGGRLYDLTWSKRMTGSGPYADMLRLLAMRLSAAGYRVQTVASAEAALAELAIERPRLVVSDVQLPGRDGLLLPDHAPVQALWSWLSLL